MNFHNTDLNLDIDNILFMLDSIETDLTKLAVSKEFDGILEYPFAIDVEDHSFFYIDEKQRDEDYEKLCEFLNVNSKHHFYF